ncbi:MAG: DUF5615 family PIN-like protein [Cyanobacteria bacterium CRU_2_1]|nr:DUF5615 family PIN-like protein [Cyanobacteria bacterium RU_5_0]NJR58162.1 DUF5615 family PIN-like protein [Cyanobacteria bacterium CRU_2_1]
MFILLDENLLSKKLKQPFVDAGHSVSNVYDLGWRGLKDHEILDRAEAHPFDAFVTADKNLPYQQNLRNRSLRVIILDTGSTRPSHLMPLVVQVSSLVASLSIGTSIQINDAGEVTVIHSGG